MDVLLAGDHVWCAEAAGEPLALTEHLAAAGHDLTVVLGLSMTDTFRAEHAERLRFLGFGGFGGNRRLTDADVLEVLPVGLASVASLVRSGRLPVDVVFLQVAADGANSGVTAGYLGAAVARARTVVGQVNPRLPRTFGDTELRRVDVRVPADRALPTVRASADPDLAGAIAEHLGRIVGDGAVLQVGWGALPDAVVARLTGKRGLTVHSGAIGDAAVRLHRAGALVDREPAVVAGMLAGTEELYEFADRNPAVEVWSYEHLHRSSVLARLGGLTMVNTALEIDLTGQVNSESAGGRYVGAVGGLVEFARSARITGGTVVFVVPARRIVPALTGPVTLPRSEVDLVVTERGIADLRGKSLAEREQVLTGVSG
ncbi:acetyl-CoA hydrolase/transferase C-terminal domain-containing protein [Actinophytocola sediminis]